MIITGKTKNQESLADSSRRSRPSAVQEWQQTNIVISGCILDRFRGVELESHSSTANTLDRTLLRPSTRNNGNSSA